MRQAIVTKYFGPTDSRGSRVKATCQAGSVTIPWDHALNSDENHLNAAQALVHKLGWGTRVGNTYVTRLVGGGLPDGKGNAYVILEGAP